MILLKCNRPSWLKGHELGNVLPGELGSGCRVVSGRTGEIYGESVAGRLLPDPQLESAWRRKMFVQFARRIVSKPCSKQTEVLLSGACQGMSHVGSGDEDAALK